MLRLKRILCPTDFSEFSDRALRYATELAARANAELLVQHVMEDLVVMAPDLYASLSDFQAMRQTYENEILDALRQAVSPATATTIISKGNPSVEILKTAQEKDADLIVMGTHGRKGIGRLVIGSVAEEVVKKALCPVLTVCHLAYEPNRPLDFRRVLVAVDFSDYSLRALETAMSLAEDFGSELYLLHVIEKPLGAELNEEGRDPVSHNQAMIETTRSRLALIVPDDIRAHHRVKEIASVGAPHREIVQTARDVDADLVIMGVVGHGALRSALFGSTTYRVIKDIHCPVLTVRGLKSEGQH